MTQDTTVVPDDHEVTIFHMSIEPGVLVTEGNVIIANFGVAGDDADKELDEILAAVDSALAADATAQLVTESGPILLSSLFAPNVLKTLSVRSPITWVFHDGSVLSTMASERRRGLVISFMQRLARASIPQAVYFVEPPEPSVALFAQHMIGLGVGLRQPDANEGDLTIQIEVKRPDGIFTVLAGTPIPLDGLPELYKPGALAALPPQVVTRRVEKLEITDRPVAFRSPRLRQLMLDLETSSDQEEQMSSLLEELIARDLPLFLLRSPTSEELETRTFGGERALPVYADVICLHWAAADGNLAKDAYVPGPADPAPLIKHAASGNLGLAIGAYKDRQTPFYTVLPAALLSKLAARL